MRQKSNNPTLSVCPLSGTVGVALISESLGFIMCKQCNVSALLFCPQSTKSLPKSVFVQLQETSLMNVHDDQPSSLLPSLW